MSGLQEQANQAIDKLRTTVISLSGGALGSTVIFLKDIIGVSNKCALSQIKVSWIFWLFSIVVTLLSYFCQYQGLLFENRGDTENVRYTATGKWYYAMALSYLAGTIAFVIGVVIAAFTVLSTIK